MSTRWMFALLGAVVFVGATQSSATADFLDHLFGPDTYDECRADAAKEATSDAALRVLVADCRKRFPPQKKSTDTMLYLDCIFEYRIKFKDEGVIAAVPYFKIDLASRTLVLIHGPKTLSSQPKTLEANDETVAFGSFVWNRRSGDLYLKEDGGYKKANSCYLE